MGEKRYFWLKTAIASLIAIGFLVLVGWAFNVPFLRSVLPNLATMEANTALGLLLIGAALWQLKDEGANSSRRRVAVVCTVVVLLLGLLTLSEYAFGWNLGIDEFLVKDTAATIHPGRMTEATAFSFVLLGSSLLLLIRSTQYRVMQGFALIVLSLALLAIGGYLYGVEELYGVFAFSSVAVHTALALLIASLSILLTHPDKGFMAAINTNASGGVMARRLMPAVVLLPLLMGWLRLQGQEQGLYGTGSGWRCLPCRIFSSLRCWCGGLRTGSIMRMSNASRPHSP